MRLIKKKMDYIDKKLFLKKSLVLLVILQSSKECGQFIVAVLNKMQSSAAQVNMSGQITISRI